MPRRVKRSTSTRTPTGKPCVNCVAEGITTKRKTYPPGPRCATHARAKKFDRKTYTHEKHIFETYGITSKEYEAIYNHQGGVCFICRRARGMAKKLSVDHCHKTGLVRGLLCQPCNKMLGHLRDDPEAARRIAEYLAYPPAVAVLGRHTTPDMREQ